MDILARHLQLALAVLLLGLVATTAGWARKPPPPPRIGGARPESTGAAGGTVAPRVDPVKARPRPLAAGPTVQVRKLEVTAFPKVDCQVAATDAAGAPIAGLLAKDWLLAEDGKPLPFACTPGRPDKQALAVVLAVDTSGSMRGAPLMQARAAAADFVARLGPEDTCSLAAFSTRVRTVGTLHGSDPAVKDLVKQLSAGGDTALYEALAHSADLLAGAKADRKVLVLLTDGKDTAGTLSREQAIARCTAAGVAVHTIGLGRDPEAAVLREVASRTGGAYHPAARPENLLDLYRRILSAVQSYYVLSYQAPEEGPGQQWRQVRVALARTPEAAADGQYLPPTRVASGPDDLLELLAQSWLPLAVGACVVLNLGLAGALLRRRLRR